VPTLSGGINTALSAVLANTYAIQVVNQNVANANTPGYRRQLAALKTAPPTAMFNGYSNILPGQTGSGVRVDLIQRFSSDLLDAHYRAASGETQNWQARQQVSAQIESILSPTTDNGLPAKMDQFWAEWGKLASDPANLTLRGELLTQANDLASAFNSQANQLNQLRADQNGVLVDQVNQINASAQQIAGLNGEIAQALALGQQPNDLMDQRDLLLDQLAASAGATSSLQKDGSVLVAIGGHSLVTNITATNLSAVNDTDPQNAGLLKVQWDDNARTLAAPSGTLSGIFIARDQTIPKQLAWLNNLAEQLASGVNNLHQTGYAMDGATTGQPFFVPRTAGQEAATLKVNGTLTAGGIAASASGLPGDSQIADAISRLKLDKTVIPGANLTFNDYLNNQVTSLAMDVQHANTSTAHNQLLVDALTNQRASESGVSLDEEAANLAKYERAYQAAGRLMTAFDQMMDTIINGMGLVGRG
jgi:flagellar hook-associated protein 1 FlgK